MSKRNWLTVLTLAGLIVGALVGEVIYRGTLGIEDRGEKLRTHDELVRKKQDAETPWTTSDQAALERAREQAGGLLTQRTFRKAADYVGAKIFMGLLKMLIMPLIISSVICGVTSAGDFARLGNIAGKTFFYFFATMLVAVTLGIILVSVIRPGNGFFEGPEGEAARQAYLEMGEAKRAEISEKQERGGVAAPKTTLDALLGIVVRMIPSNPFQAIVEGNTLPVIVFSLLFGIMLSLIGPRGQPMVDVARAVMDAMIKLTEYVLLLAPVGVFFLVGRAVSDIGVEQFAEKIGLYMATVIFALLFHGFVVLPTILIAVGRANPWRYLGAMREAVLLAFSTASSSATLPVTLDCAQTRGGCSRKASGFVLPLGSTINMDGTALYEAVAVIFLAQAFSPEPIPLTAMVVLALTATLAAVGAAGIPEAGLTTMILVISAVNAGGVAYIPPAAIGLILGVDRILDMTRTMVNVWGDAIGARIITRYADDDEDNPVEAGPGPAPASA